MPLLVDGKPYELTNEERERYSRDIVFHVPQEVVRNDEKNKRLAVPASWGIECQYIMYDVATKKNKRVIYYETSYHDENRKRDVYAPTHFLMPSTGYIKFLSFEAEKNWFMMNHPGNYNNKVRNHESRPYARVQVQFWTHDPNEKAKLRQERTAYLYKCLSYIQSGLPTSWSYKQLQNACEVLLQEAGNRPLPFDLLNYKDFSEEEHEVLRAAVSDLAYQDALWVFSRTVEGRHTEIADWIKKAMNTEESGFGYDAKNNYFFHTVETSKDAKGDPKMSRVVFLNVPKTKDPQKYLFETCQTNKEVLDKIIQLVMAYENEEA